MQIEVATEVGDSTKDKGDLFEGLIKDLLKAQNYEVAQEIRVTGVELDLLCKHKVNGREIYVECKAQREKISAPILSKLIGVVNIHDYSEGWIISTSEYGKDALGIVDVFSKKPKDISSKFSFYTPERVVDSLVSAGVIKEKPKDKAASFMGGEDSLGSWVLMITKFGRYWAVYTLNGGAPHGVLLYSAITGKLINDSATIDNISKLESIICDYDLSIGLVNANLPILASSLEKESLVSVVEVQIGDSWDDYRPARPKDFVGRDEMQKEILGFLSNVRDKTSNTRIFSITGNSGLGKSSLIAKIRDRSKNKHYHKRYFVYAVDIRGAKSPSYISAAFLNALKEAQKNGFGNKIELQLSDPNNHFASSSISNYLDSVQSEGKIICLIFDQFEELYSKPELFTVFNAAQSLMLDTAGYKGNFTLGFAWKTDSTTQQDHPAYHMWHNLSDMRREFKLSLFDSGEISKSITTFEKEFDHKVAPEIRNQISYGCQGFPWLLKKLCVNLRENYKKGSNTTLSIVDLDVEKLFTNDLDLLTPSEKTCLNLIAQKAPADWSEIIELSSVSEVSNLVNKRMVIKSGDRLNIYWDIFKDYLVTNKLPIIPYNYIPTSDFAALSRVAQALNKEDYLSSNEISLLVDFKEKTILNIGADLVMLGVSERSGSNFKLSMNVKDKSENEFLLKIRERFGKHSLKINLYKKYLGKSIDNKIMVESLKESLPKSHHSETTWSVYSRRLAKYLHLTGYLSQSGETYLVQDAGAPQRAISSWRKSNGKNKSSVFSPNASPFLVIETCNHIKNGKDITYIIDNGCRNGITVLKRFLMITNQKKKYSINQSAIAKYADFEEALWSFTKTEPSIIKCLEIIRSNPTITNKDLGKYISDEFSVRWSESSAKRFGNSLMQWSKWVRDGIDNSCIPPLPGGKNK